MKFGPLQLSYSGIGITVAGITAIGLTGGATAAQHPEPSTQTVTVQEGSISAAEGSAPRTTLDAYLTGGAEYVVRSGDTLAKIAGREYGDAGCWPGIWAANTGKIRNPDLIYAGESISIPAACSTHGPVEETAAVSHPAPAPAAPRASTEDAGYSVDSSFQACVIERESGGNADIWNASGHWGLYQFAYATWVHYGGAPAEFGHASAAEQTVVFDNAMATPGGAENWAPSDGC